MLLAFTETAFMKEHTRRTRLVGKKNKNPENNTDIGAGKDKRKHAQDAKNRQ